MNEAQDQTTRRPSPETGAGKPKPGRRSHRGRLIVLAIVALAVVGVAWFALSLFQPFKGDGTGEFGLVIPLGASLGYIAELLEA